MIEVPKTFVRHLRVNITPKANSICRHVRDKTVLAPRETENGKDFLRIALKRIGKVSPSTHPLPRRGARRKERRVGEFPDCLSLDRHKVRTVRLNNYTLKCVSRHRFERTRISSPPRGTTRARERERDSQDALWTTSRRKWMGVHPTLGPEPPEYVGPGSLFRHYQRFSNRDTYQYKKHRNRRGPKKGLNYFGYSYRNRQTNF